MLELVNTPWKLKIMTHDSEPQSSYSELKTTHTTKKTLQMYNQTVLKWTASSSLEVLFAHGPDTDFKHVTGRGYYIIFPSERLIFQLPVLLIIL